MKPLTSVLVALLALAWSLALPVQAAQSACDPDAHAVADVAHANGEHASHHPDMHEHEPGPAQHSDHQCDHGDNCQCPPACHVPVAAIAAAPAPASAHAPSSPKAGSAGVRTPAHRWPLIRPPSDTLS